MSKGITHQYLPMQFYTNGLHLILPILILGFHVILLMSVAMDIRGSGSGKVHNAVDFPEDLSATFSSEAVTADIAANFPGVNIMKDTVSCILHIFGPDAATVDKAVFALKNFISEACLQKIYAEAYTDAVDSGFSEPAAPQPSTSFSASKSATKPLAVSISNGPSDNNEPIGLEIELNDVAPDITDEEIRSNFAWMQAESIECPKDKTNPGDFLTGTIYVKFKNRRDCSTARERLQEFYPHYKISTISKGSWDKIISPFKKKATFQLPDSDVLEQYFRHHESDDGGDPEKMKKDALARQNLLGQYVKVQQPPPRPKSSDASGFSRRQNLSPERSPVTAPRRQLSPTEQSPYHSASARKNFAGANSVPSASDLSRSRQKTSSSARSPYFQQPAAVSIPPQVPSRRRRPIAIDANNLCMHHGNHQFYSCFGLELAINYFLDRGHSEVFAFIPEMKIRCPPMSQNPRIERQDILHRLEGERRLTVIPRKKLADGSKFNPYDDVLIVKFAYETRGVIISNDNMIDVGRDNPRYRDYIDRWRITFCFAGDHFMLIDDPNGRRGIRAEEMLLAD